MSFALHCSVDESRSLLSMKVSFASINTTTNALTFMVLDLAARPEYTQPLRDEIEEVIKQDNIEEDENGVLRFKQSSLAKLWKLDSFMKESSRLSKNSSKTTLIIVQHVILTCYILSHHRAHGYGSHHAFHRSSTPEGNSVCIRCESRPDVSPVPNFLPGIQSAREQASP